MASNFKRIPVTDIKLGIRFSAPVFFDDGENMFLAEGKSVKPYHINTIKKWSLPYLLTYGHILKEGDLHNTKEDGFDDLDVLEELEEV